MSGAWEHLFEHLNRGTARIIRHFEICKDSSAANEDLTLQPNTTNTKKATRKQSVSWCLGSLVAKRSAPEMIVVQGAACTFGFRSRTQTKS
jgi:hypothetical protein